MTCHIVYCAQADSVEERAVCSRSKSCSCTRASDLGTVDSQPVKSPLAFEEFSDCFGAGADLELLVNAADVSVNSLVADAKFVGDFLVQETLA
jgi:hypothetical protein